MIRLGCIFVLFAAAAAAHGPLHEQIELVTAQIRKQPANARLYLKRGELYRLHRELPEAGRDYARASDLDRNLPGLDLALGRFRLDSGDPAGALEPLTRAIERDPESGEALASRAGAYERGGRFREAGQDFDSALQISAYRQVEMYLAASHAWRKAGDPGAALERLDDGIRRLGRLTVLELAAIEIDRSLAQWDRALGRIDWLEAQSPRKETWLARRAALLEEAGREAEARAEYRRALECIQSLPPSLRATRAMADLARGVSVALERLRRSG